MSPGDSERLLEAVHTQHRFVHSSRGGRVPSADLLAPHLELTVTIQPPDEHLGDPVKQPGLATKPPRHGLEESVDLHTVARQVDERAQRTERDAWPRLRVGDYVIDQGDQTPTDQIEQLVSLISLGFRVRD